MAKRSFDSMVAAVVAAWEKREQSAAASAIEVGRRAHQAVVFRLRNVADRGGRRTIRAEAVEAIGTQLRAAGFTARGADVNRTIACYNVARIYGDAEARLLPLRTLRAFTATIKRNTADETWSIRAKHQEAFYALWQRVVAGEVKPDQVQVEVDRILGKQPRPAKPKPSARDKAVRLVAQLSEADQRAIWSALHKRFAGDVPRAEPVEPAGPAAPTIPMQQQPRESAIDRVKRRFAS